MEGSGDVDLKGNWKCNPALSHGHIPTKNNATSANNKIRDNFMPLSILGETFLMFVYLVHERLLITPQPEKNATNAPIAIFQMESADPAPMSELKHGSN